MNSKCRKTIAITSATCLLLSGEIPAHAQNDQCPALNQTSLELKAKTAQLVGKYPKVVMPLLACAATASLISDKNQQMVYGLGCGALVCYNTDMSSCESLVGEVISLALQADVITKQMTALKCESP